jgi:hypothetical protein
MRVTHPELLDEFRGQRCEWCQKPRTMSDAAHLWAKGHGGGGRLDVRVNLIALCRVCHRTSHDRPCHADLLLIVAQREGVLQPDIEEVIHLLRRLSKRPTKAEIAAELREMSPGARPLARKTLAEVPVEQQYWRVVE